MKKIFNRQSITIKVNAVQSLDKWERGTDKANTELKHDSLQILLNSPNPLRIDYDFNDSNYNEIKELQNKMRSLLCDAEFLLKNTKK